ncbi:MULTISPECIES: Ig domain-containing protein [unclassified Streptomyces]|uniref:Ig domain-containing protein n=1 Tax=unclassified Streptomyces TaxID=2593676 RepID=UPI00225230D6|nr:MULTISPECIES: Ig domain-containing protein [unclassified Streptomyces]MCX4553427.1 Ig domain-containing protein [Streptomyces sp. NBC_01500]WSC18388.1 Ig domain-containing protein [Streptomyces sp. NBC_01766]WSV52430.1 Ig domain-containing protein [Streptomyces sp. NBC_01014]
MDRRRFLAVSGLSSITAMGTLVPAAATAQAVQTGTGGTSQAQRITAGFLSVGLSNSGRVNSLVDLRSDTDYLAAGTSVPLVSVVADGTQEVPVEVKASPRDRRVLVFRSARTTIEVKVVRFATHSTLEVVGLTAAPGVDVQTLLWGPLPTKIAQTIGETAGVVGNSEVVLGVRPLNDKTVGGWPNEHLAYGFGPDLIWNPYGLQTGAKDEWLASNVAAKTTWGSVLRATTYDYSRVRLRQRTNGYEIPLGPLPAPEGRIVGSKIALFGSAPELALTVLSQIAEEHGQAYPTIGGQWQKAAQRTSQSHFWIHDLDTSNAAAAGRYAVQAGVRNIYAITGDGPWVSHGHYQFNSSFGGSDAAAAQLVATAAKEGAEVGVHTLSDFIDADDPYVKAPADPRLAEGGSFTLTRPLGGSDTTLYVDADRPLGPGVDGTRLRIGDEILTYGTVTKVGTSEWRVDGLARAQWGSAARPCPAGTRGARLIQNGYGGAIGGLPIIDEMATRLATAYNDTGVRATSYDGLESAGYNGWGGYGFARLVNGVYRQLGSKEFITECSNLSSNTWDAQSRASWGEIGSTSYEQLIRSNTFYRANYLPGMMGQQGFSGDDSLQTIEVTMARAASLNAGINFETSVQSLASGSNTAALLQAVKTWESARRSGAFTADQKQKLGDPSTYWHLSEVTPDQEWSLRPVDSSGRPIGEPQQVKAPTPGFTTPEPPDARAGELYAFKVTSSTPQTTRYEVTSGGLPAGLTLNKDTGGITGVPTRTGASRFTITARNGGTTADAEIAYRVTTRP